MQTGVRCGNGVTRGLGDGSISQSGPITKIFTGPCVHLAISVDSMSIREAASWPMPGFAQPKFEEGTWSDIAAGGLVHALVPWRRAASKAIYKRKDRRSWKVYVAVLGKDTYG